MKLIDKYEFTNGKLFETYLLEQQDVARFNIPECDVIGLRRVGDDNDLMSVMRPDEALIQARMLVDAVRKVTGGYEIELEPSSCKQDLFDEIKDAIKSIEWAGKPDPATMTTLNKELGEYMRDVLAAVDKTAAGYASAEQSPMRRGTDGRAYPSQPLATELVRDLEGAGFGEKK